MNALRNKFSNIKEVLFINKIDKPLVIYMLMSVEIVIIAKKSTTLTKGITDFSPLCV